MICLEPVTYKILNQYKCSFLTSTKFYLILVAWIVGMLLISSLAVSLMILSVSSIASKIPKLNKTRSTFNIFSKGIPMHSVQPDVVRPLKPSNHKLMSMPQVNTPSMQHETLRLLERLEVQPNYYNPRNMKGKLLLPAWRLTHLPDERLPTDRSSFSSQIPRPPRLTRTSSENRRQYVEPASEQPRPFNFPLDGPQPSEFKKTKSSKKDIKKVNNIQDILKQDHIPNVNHYRMPVGIHISGSFKNLQNSGISNVFRKYVQLQPPQMAPSLFNYQRIAFDPFYPYKPKSLNEINSLAMKQLGLNRKKKKNKNNMMPGLIYQQTGHRPVSADYYLDALRLNNSPNAFGGQRNLKNEPFSLKLEVYPIRTGKKAPVLPVKGAQFVTTIRPNAQNFEPFFPQIGIPYSVPIDNGASYLNYMNNQQQYKARFPQSPSILYSGGYQRDKSPSDSDGLATHPEEINKPSEKKPKANSNQLMVHLNVFPSKKENVVPPNHLYDVIHADVHERSSSNVAAVKNETYIDCETDEKSLGDEADPAELYNYQRHRVSKENPPTLENFAEQVAERPLEMRLNETLSRARNESENAGEKLSTFRFPVENLIQFQANDAVI